MRIVTIGLLCKVEALHSWCWQVVHVPCSTLEFRGLAGLHMGHVCDANSGTISSCCSHNVSSVLVWNTMPKSHEPLLTRARAACPTTQAFQLPESTPSSYDRASFGEASTARSLKGLAGRAPPQLSAGHQGSSFASIARARSMQSIAGLPIKTYADTKHEQHAKFNGQLLLDMPLVIALAEAGERF